MSTSFHGGPYDGLVLDDDELSEFTILVPVHRGTGIRVFALLPPLDAWAEVRSRRRSIKHAGRFYAYELSRDSRGEVEFRDAQSSGEFQRVIRLTR